MAFDTCDPCCDPTAMSRSLQTYHQGVLITLCGILGAIGSGGSSNATAANQILEIAALDAINAKITTVNTGAVTISTALPAGNNNIGNVDIVTMPSVTLASQASPFTSNVNVAVNAALPAGNNNIGDVDIASMPSVTVGVLPSVTLASQASPFTSNVNVAVNAALPTGTNSIGNIGTVATVTGVTTVSTVTTVSAVTAITNALPAGNNNIGDVDIASIAAGNNNIGDVDVASIAAGSHLIGKVGLSFSSTDVTLANALPVRENYGSELKASSNGTAVTSSTNTSMVALIASTKIVPQRLHLTNSHATVGVKCAIRSSTTGNLYFETFLSANGGTISIPINGAFETVAGEALYLNTDAAANVYWTVTYHTV